MGTALSATLEKTVTEESWTKLGRGPQLRQLFGAYRSNDCWAVKRKFVAIDDGDGYVSYEEMQQLCYLPEFSLMFIWDNFSQQNELLDPRELLTLICIFSSARLDEKGRFLLSLFDASACGRNTGAEIAQLCIVVLNVFARCCGLVVKPKDVLHLFKAEFGDLVPEFREAEREVGTDRAFRSERVVGAEQLDRMLPSIRAAYEALPTYGQPPPDAMKPPPSEWAAAPAKEDPKKADKNSQRKVPQKKKKESELAHLAWMTKLDDPVETCVVEAADEDENDELGHSWLLMKGKEFQTIAGDVPGFERMFVKCVSQSLGLAADCVEVVCVTSGSIIVEFRIYAPGHSGDPRSASALLELLEAQLKSKHSLLRKGPLGPFTDSTELLPAEPKRMIPKPETSPASPKVSDMGAQTAGTPEPAEMWAEAGTQVDFGDFGTPRLKASGLKGVSAADAKMMRQIRETVKELDVVRNRTTAMEKASGALRFQVIQRDSDIAELRASIVIARDQEEQRPKTPPVKKVEAVIGEVSADGAEIITFEINGTKRVAKIIGSKKADVMSLMTHHIEYLSGADGDEWVRLDETKGLLTDEKGHGNISFERNSPG